MSFFDNQVFAGIKALINIRVLPAGKGSIATKQQNNAAFYSRNIKPKISHECTNIRLLGL
jgi:hypothetical protein